MHSSSFCRLRETKPTTRRGFARGSSSFRHNNNSCQKQVEIYRPTNWGIEALIDDCVRDEMGGFSPFPRVISNQYRPSPQRSSRLLANIDIPTLLVHLRLHVCRQPPRRPCLKAPCNRAFSLKKKKEKKIVSC